MPPLSTTSRPATTATRRLVHIEYLDFRGVPGYREYRLAVCGPDGTVELRFRIEAAAFGDGRVRLQDGPDVCYQKLLRAVTAGETLSPDVITIDDAELASYREAHTPVPKRRAWTTSLPAKPPVAPRPEPVAPVVRPPVAALAVSETETVGDEGRRVNHAAFGFGVVASSSRGHTTVCFDEGGMKTFVKSMVELEVLSEPRTWETSPRGKNRLRKTAPTNN